MPINKRIIEDTLKGLDRPTVPMVLIPEELLHFLPANQKVDDPLELWLEIDVRNLREFLILSRDGSVDGGVEFHHTLGTHIGELFPYVSRMNTLLARDPDATPQEKDKFYTAHQHLMSARMELLPQSIGTPITLELNLPRKAKKNKSDGKPRELPTTSMAFAVPVLELLNGIVTQHFHEEELSGIIAEITGYSRANIVTFRCKNLNSTRKQELITMLRDMIHSIEESM